MEIDSDVDLSKREIREIRKIVKQMKKVMTVVLICFLIYNLGFEGNFYIFNILFYYIPMIIMGSLGSKIYINYGVSYEPLYIGGSRLISGVTGFIVFMCNILVLFGGAFMVFYEIISKFQ